MRGHENVLKRLLVHAGAFNLGLWMRTLFGIGTPRGLQGRLAALTTLLSVLSTCIDDATTVLGLQHRDPTRSDPQSVGIVLVRSFA